MVLDNSVFPRSRRVALPASLKEAAAQEIRRQVFAGVLRPGVRIDQDAVAERLGISKLPVREALIALEVEGVIEVVPRRGAFVARLSREDVRDQYWMLGVISGLAAERAAARMSPASLEALDEIAARMETEVSSERLDLLNFEFHRVINRASRSRRLVSELKVLGSAIPHGFYESHAQWSAAAHADHREIIDALRAGAGDVARKLTEDHFLRGGNRAVALLEERGFWDDAAG